MKEPAQISPGQDGDGRSHVYSCCRALHRPYKPLGPYLCAPTLQPVATTPGVEPAVMSAARSEMDVVAEFSVYYVTT